MKAPLLQLGYSSLEESHTPTPRPQTLSVQRLNRFLSLEGYLLSTCTSAPPSSRLWPPRSPCRHEVPPVLEKAGPPPLGSRPTPGDDGSFAMTTHPHYPSLSLAAPHNAPPTPTPDLRCG